MESPAEQRYCLERTASINPGSAAKKALPALDTVDARAPEEPKYFDEPPVPEGLIQSTDSRGGSLRCWRWVALAGLPALMVVTPILFWQFRRTPQQDKIYVAMLDEQSYFAILRLRRGGYKGLIMGSDSMGTSGVCAELCGGAGRAAAAGLLHEQRACRFTSDL